MTTAVASKQRIEDIYRAASVATRSSEPRARRPGYVVDVSRPVLPRHWTSMLLAPVELLAVAWSIPFVILLIGIPIALAAALILWIARFAISQF